MESPEFLARDPVSGKTLDLSITSHPDNETKGKLFKDGQDLQQLALAEDMTLSDSLQRICSTQHTGRFYTAGIFDRTSSHEHQIFGEAGFIMRINKRKRLPFVSTLQKKHGPRPGEGGGGRG